MNDIEEKRGSKEFVPTSYTTISEMEGADLNQFAKPSADKKIVKKKKIVGNSRKNIDLSSCVWTLVRDKHALCDDKDWCALVDMLQYGGEFSNPDNAKMLPKEFYIGMALVLDYETNRKDNLSISDDIFKELASPIADAMIDEDDYVDDEHSYNYAMPVIEVLCNIYNNLHNIYNRERDGYNVELQRRIISPILKESCKTRGRIFGDWGRMIAEEVVELAAKVATEMGRNDPYVVVYEQMATIERESDKLDDRRMLTLMDNKGDDAEAEVRRVILFFVLSVRDDVRRKAVMSRIHCETMEIICNLEEQCEIALALREIAPETYIPGHVGIDGYISHLENVYSLAHPSELGCLVDIRTDIKGKMENEKCEKKKYNEIATPVNNSDSLGADKTVDMREDPQNNTPNYDILDTGADCQGVKESMGIIGKEDSSPNEASPTLTSQITINEPAIPIPANLFSLPEGNSEEFIPNMASFCKDAGKIERLVDYLQYHDFIGKDNLTRLTFVYRLTGRKIKTDFIPIKKIMWGKSKKAADILYMCGVLYKEVGAKKVKPTVYPAAKRFFCADSNGKKPFSEMGSPYASDDHVDKELVNIIEQLFKTNKK